MCFLSVLFCGYISPRLRGPCLEGRHTVLSACVKEEIQIMLESVVDITAVMDKIQTQ